MIAPAQGESTLTFVVAFSPQPQAVALPSFETTRTSAAASWRAFWEGGAMLDFSGSTDPRAWEIEERIIRSQYLMAAQMAGDVPPQESGLTCNTWYGKHHTEMIWWHAAHFALWGHDELLAPQPGLVPGPPARCAGAGRKAAA